VLPPAVVELEKIKDTELLGKKVVEMADNKVEPELETDMLELNVDEVEKMLELALLDATLELELLDVVPLPAISAVVALLLEVMEAELVARMELDDVLFEGFVLVLCNEVVLLMMEEKKPAVEALCMLTIVLELEADTEVVLPRVFEVVDRLELICMLEVLVDAPLLDPVDGPETPVGVVHFDAGAFAVRLVAEDHSIFVQGYRIRPDAWSCPSESL
jgi:hypothetical protein